MNTTTPGSTWNNLAAKIDPASYFQPIRHEQPVYFDEGYRAFVVTRHKDVAFVLGEPRVFSSAKALFSSYNHQDVVEGILNSTAHGPFIEVLPMTDPPEHTRIRKIVNTTFNARCVARIRGYIEEVSQELVTGFAGDGKAEIVAQFAKPLPVRVIGALLSIPPERADDIVRWTSSYSTCAGNIVRDEQHARQTGEALAEMQNFIASILDERRAQPGDDTLTDLLNARVEGFDPLTDREILAISAAYIGAGHESTTIAITELVKLLAESPDIAEELRNADDQDQAIRQFVEELLRMRPPLTGQPRVTVEDVQIGETLIPAGSFVIVANISANRDEAVFGEDAEHFDRTRRNASRHTSFGGGVHVCLGNMLARAELQQATKSILSHLGNLRPAQSSYAEADYGPAIMDWNYHLTRLDVTFDQRSG